MEATATTNGANGTDQADSYQWLLEQLWCHCGVTVPTIGTYTTAHAAIGLLPALGVLDRSALFALIANGLGAMVEPTVINHRSGRLLQC
jgi:hypothetical protein